MFLLNKQRNERASALTSFGASQNLLPTRPLKSSTSRSVGYRFTRRVSLPSSCSSIYTRFGVRRLARIYYGTRSVSYLGCSSVFGQHRVVCVGHSSLGLVWLVLFICLVAGEAKLLSSLLAYYIDREILFFFL